MLRGQRDPGSRWTEHDTSLAVALTVYEQSLCSGCGQPAHESMSADADPGNRDGLWHYEVDLPVRCHACTALDEAAKPYQDVPAPSALRFLPVKIDDDEEVPG